jgi:predicted dienelactone hydrolase
MLKKPMKKSAALLRLIASFFLFTAGFAFAQNATLRADSSALAPAGGQVTLTASVSYDGQPSALGWAIALPGDWILVSVAGANVPEISPAAGSTGALEFAYTAAPAAQAEFSVVVRYPAGSSAAKAVPTVLVRAQGKLATLTPAPVEFAR